VTDKHGTVIHGTLALGAETTVEFTGPISGDGTITLAADATLAVDAKVSKGLTIDFMPGDGETLAVGAPLDMHATIDGLAAGDAITFAGDYATVSRSFSGDVMTVYGDGAEIGKFTFAPGYGDGNTAVSDNGDQVTIACFLAGTRIRTPRGEVAVEALAIGDSVDVASGPPRRVKWIGRRSYAARFAAANPEAVPIRVAAGALADGVPARDLHVSPMHALLLDGVLVPARCLVNGASIRPCPEIDPIDYLHVELDSHDVIFAEGAAAESFVDCDSRGMFRNAAEFAALYPRDHAPSWVFCAARVEGGRRLEAIRARIDARAGLDPRPERQCGPLRGFLDVATCELVRGWAWQEAHPDTPAVLEVLVDDGVIGQVVATGMRRDVRAAGHGDGRCGFMLRLPQPLSPFVPHVVRVRRAVDGAELGHSGRRIPAAARLDAAALDGLARDLRATAAADGEAAARLIRFMEDEAAHLRGLRAAAAAAARHDARPLALVINDAVPVTGRDAGSNALLDHMRTLQRLGYRVAFAARDMGADADVAALDALGVTAARIPAEAALRRCTAAAVVYLHRIGTAALYLPLVRHHCPRARVIYSVADLHALRLARRAALEDRSELAAASRGLAAREIAAAGAADCVITHSQAEAAILRHAAPTAQVHVVPWSVTPRPTSVPFADRRGVAFIGGYRHAPNVEVARWLVAEIMPLVWRADPDVTCLLVGSHMPAAVRGLGGPRVEVVGQVADLAGVFDRVRLTVAPLRYGAGLKGKLLDSLAAGVPCVATPVAAEGIALPAALQRCVAGDAAALARLILRLHADAAENAACAAAGLALVRDAFAPGRIDALLAAAVGLPAEAARLAG
jgi:glycosyltransferase involved in cell wall biosynthesis